MNIEQLFGERANAEHDMAGHMGTLRALASECQHVTEFGVREGNSTIALLAGRPSTLVSYDVDRLPDVDLIALVAGDTDFTFHLESSLTAVIDPTDLLMIDTIHTAKQVYHELMRHAKNVRRYLVFHDTASCGEVDSFWPDNPAGLSYGIGRYLHETTGQWQLKAHYEHCNGLTIYERV